MLVAATKPVIGPPISRAIRPEVRLPKFPLGTTMIIAGSVILFKRAALLRTTSAAYM